MKKLKTLLEDRLGFFAVATVLFWLKTLLIYTLEFNLGVTGIIQHLILLINPVAMTVLILAIGLYFSEGKRPYHVLFGLYFLLSLLIYANAVYYREFSDFLTLRVITGTVKAGNNITSGLTDSFFALLDPIDILFWLDFVGLGFLLYSKHSPITLDTAPRGKRYAIAMSALGLAVFFGNLGLAELNRPQLLTRTFDRNYIVKYLGINFYQGYDAFQTIQNNRIRASADENDLDEIFEYVATRQVPINDEYFGIAKGRNVFTIVLESAQQFAMDMAIEDSEGNAQEVTPFFNSLYHDPQTISFSNYFHQTKQGKSSDAEILSENSLFGLPEGAAMQMFGSTNTFHAAPNLLKTEAGYTTAAFHGNVGSFWNRTDTYQQFGYDYFFDAEFFDLGEGRTAEYGLKDKIFFHDAAQYIEQLPQPFYTKYLTLSNHFPYPLDEANISFEAPDTEDETINRYFVTMHYMDQAVEEFINWTKAAGLYDHSIFIIYGDHYGISNMRNPKLADLLGVEEWTDYHNVQMQRVPMMFHIPGITNGGIFDTFGGQLDYLPTLMHLLGIETDSYLFLGEDLLSPEHQNYTVFRNGHVVTPEYTLIGEDIYDTATGTWLNDELAEQTVESLKTFHEEALHVLNVSDNVMTKDLLRFYTPRALGSLEMLPYSYMNQLPYLQEHPHKETSLREQRKAMGLESAATLYETDAPELAQ
ncbi:LTA synthase family protein [Allofustis seminis]|uniref:LTA synthase family protein n=1 Tax=Allofustis seminis TaxID=166939 RepID=UPI00037329AF|nr:LTA synthase family protein [Allofustis seminis]